MTERSNKALTALTHVGCGFVNYYN